MTMTLEDIKSAVEAGWRVCWMNELYLVVKDRIGQWHIKCLSNGDCIGLTHADGVTMNGEPEDFYIS
jgi:hypothetical protein